MREVNIRVEIPNDQIPMTNQIPNPNAELRGNDVALRNDQISTTTVESSTTSVSVVAPTSTEEAIGDGAIDGDNNSGFGATSTPNTPSPDEQSSPAPVIDELAPAPLAPPAEPTPAPSVSEALNESELAPEPSESSENSPISLPSEPAAAPTPSESGV